MDAEEERTEGKAGSLGGAGNAGGAGGSAAVGAPDRPALRATALAEHARYRAEHCIVQALIRTAKAAATAQTVAGLAAAFHRSGHAQRQAHGQVQRMCELPAPRQPVLVRGLNGRMRFEELAGEAIADEWEVQEAGLPPANPAGGGPGADGGGVRSDGSAAVPLPQAVLPLPQPLPGAATWRRTATTAPLPPDPPAAVQGAALTAEPTVRKVLEVIAGMANTTPGKTGITAHALKSGGLGAAAWARRGSLSGARPCRRGVAAGAAGSGETRLATRCPSRPGTPQHGELQEVGPH
eukprot:359319-Chlamydomonas_euryale.AAC.3